MEHEDDYTHLRSVGQKVPSQLYCVSHPAMATEYSLHLYAGSQEAAEEIAEVIFQEIDRVEELLSNYRESSELSASIAKPAMEK